jgi:hypothetical protein
MWKVPVSVSGFGKINYPSICPLSPKRGHAFCNEHSEKAQAMGYETGLRDLYKKCGVTGVEVDQGNCDFNVYNQEFQTSDSTSK